MKIVLFGASGQVGWQLRRSLATLGEVIALDVDSKIHCGDLMRPDEIRNTLRTLQPQVVVNAAAYTAVDRAEAETATAYAINETACAVLAEETRRLEAWLVHYSTDYVYDGSGDRPWTENDPTGPLSVYGKSKLAGDQTIAAANPRHLIFRTSWVYDSWGQNFLKSILKAACTREGLSVVADQWGAPARAALIADVTAIAVRQVLAGRSGETAGGVYHLAPSGYTNWHGYASLIVEEARACGMPVRVTADRIKPTTSAEYPSVAPRPRNSRLDTSHLQRTFGVCLPAWQDGVRTVVAELASQTSFLKG
jgi:dTDP-4-dehydrorhamnose reductase